MRARPKHQKVRRLGHKMKRRPKMPRQQALPKPIAGAFVNLTPHSIMVGGRVIPPCGRAARVVDEVEPAGSHGGVDLTRRRPQSVVGMPDPRDGVMYLVSARVRQACPDRPDVASPGDRIQRQDGMIVVMNLVVS